MGPHDDYAGRYDEGSAAGSVLILKKLKRVQCTYITEGMSVLTLHTIFKALGMPPDHLSDQVI